MACFAAGAQPTKRLMSKRRHIGSRQEISPVCAAILQDIDINHRGGRNSELPQRPNDGVNRLLILRIDEQTVWNAPVWFKPEQAFIKPITKFGLCVETNTRVCEASVCGCYWRHGLKAGEHPSRREKRRAPFSGRVSPRAA